MKINKDEEKKIFSVIDNLPPPLYGPPPERDVKMMKKDNRKSGKEGLIRRIKSKLKTGKKTDE